MLPAPSAPARVSIVIPAYNCQETIAAAIESCLAQSYPNTEVVVVNDGSTDGTSTVLGQFGSRIRVVSKPNGGLASARNAGARAATGDFIAWMDADDLATPNRVEVQAAVLAAHPDIALVSSDFSAFVNEDADFDASHIAGYYHAYTRLGGAERIYPHPILTPAGVPGVRMGNLYEHLLWGNFVHPPTVMARRELLERVGPFDETLRYSSDYDLLLRLSRLGAFAFVNASLLRYRRSEKQMSGAASSSVMPLETVRILEKVRTSDPVTYSRRRSLFRLRIAESLVSAASAIGPSARLEALRLLWEGLRHRFVIKPSVIALARIALPDALRRGMVGSWRRLGARTVGYLTTASSALSALFMDASVPSMLLT